MLNTSLWYANGRPEICMNCHGGFKEEDGHVVALHTAYGYFCTAECAMAARQRAFQAAERQGCGRAVQ
jgi:hypothetical protein